VVVKEMEMRSRSFGHLLKSLCAVAAIAGFGWTAQPSLAREMLLSEPVHGVSFLPVYVAKSQGYFKDEGIDLTIQTMSGAAFVNAVLTGQAFAFLGSVDHDAFAAAQGKSMKAVSALVARANIYLLARTDLMPVGNDLVGFLRGKRIAGPTYGRTPSNVLRYLLAKWGLAPGQDVTLIEVDSPVIPATVAAKQADVGVSAEPFISIAYKQGIWGQPIYNAAKEFGPFPDTAVNVLGDSIQKEPALVKGLVKAVMRGLIYTHTHQAEMISFATKEYPTASPDDLKASLDRAFADDIYSTDGFIPPESWTTSEAVVRQAGILKQHVGYDEVIDMRFVKEVQKELAAK
jgi:NitT/TauT family transport system substrate-binding protein